MSKVVRDARYFEQMKTQSNSRFAPKSFSVDTTDAIKNYFEFGGAITVCKRGKRNKANTSFPAIRGSISHMGAKSNNLKTLGQARGKNSA